MDDEQLVAEFECGEFRCRNMFWEFIYIVGIPAAVLTFIVFSVCFLACMGLCKRKRKMSPEDQTQLLRYQSIRHASLSLRNLSHNRDTPLLTSRADRDARTASLSLEAEHRYRRAGRGTASAPGTLQRDRDRHHRHQRDRHSDIPSQYSAPRSYPSDGDINQGSGVEYAEVHHGLTAAAAAAAAATTTSGESTASREI